MKIYFILLNVLSLLLFIFFLVFHEGDKRNKNSTYKILHVYFFDLQEKKKKKIYMIKFKKKK